MPLRNLKTSVEIIRPVADVIAFVGDCKNDPIWRTSVLESRKKEEGEPYIGMVYHVKEKILGRVIEHDWMITERNDNGSYWSAKSSAGPFPMASSMRLEANGDSTFVQRTLSIDVGHLFIVASPVVGYIARCELEMDFAKLKELLEADD